MTHARGPWKQSTLLGFGHCVEDANGVVVTKVNNDNDRALIALIAAAPELADALAVALQDRLDNHPDCCCCQRDGCLCDQWRTLLRKAGKL